MILKFDEGDGNTSYVRISIMYTRIVIYSSVLTFAFDSVEFLLIVGSIRRTDKYGIPIMLFSGNILCCMSSV